MNRGRKLFLALSFVVLVGSTLAHAANSHSFLCQEPGGKRLIEFSGENGKEVSKPGGSTLIYIDGNDILVGDIHATATLVVDDHDVRPSPTGVKIATFDGDNILHGTSDKVLINYKHPNLCPTFADDRIYSVEGDELSKQQLVAGLYLLKPEMFKLSEEETAAQIKDMKDAEAEVEKQAAADQVAGKWQVLNSHGPVEKLGQGSIVVAPKKGDAYPVTFDLTKGGGPNWTGVGIYKEFKGDKTFWTAYGTPKSIGLCVYEIDGGNLKGTWYPWYIDGDAKNTGTEELKGPESLDGDFTITSAKAPTSGTPYSGTVTIKPLNITGADDNGKPYSVTWTMGTVKVNGIGIRSGKFLFVSSGSGADVMIAKYKIDNGTMNCDWFKLGSNEMGGAAAMSMN